jgi:hypothetical protein
MNINQVPHMEVNKMCAIKLYRLPKISSVRQRWSIIGFITGTYPRLVHRTVAIFERRRRWFKATEARKTSSLFVVLYFNGRNKWWNESFVRCEPNHRKIFCSSSYYTRNLNRTSLLNLRRTYLMVAADTSRLGTEQLSVRIPSLFPSSSVNPPRFGGKAKSGLGSEKSVHRGGI